MRICLFAWLAIASLNTPLLAQSMPSKQVSPARLFKFPERAAFTVDFGGKVQPGQPTPPGGRKPKTLVKAEVTTTEKMRRIINLWDDGSTTEDWRFENYRLIEHPSGKWINLVNVSKSSYGGPLNYDASDFAWISIQNRAGEASYKGRPCLRFELADAGAAQSHPREAIIDEQTPLPVILRHGDTLATFTFRQAPQGELQLPPRFEQRWKEFLKSRQSR